MNLERSIEYFLAAKRAEGLTDASITTYVNRLYRFAKAMPDIEQTTDIDRFTLNEYIAKMQNDPNLKDVTVNSNVRAIRAFCTWLYGEDLIRANPFRPEGGKNRVKVPKFEQKRVEVLSDENFRLLLKTCNRLTDRDRRDEAILMFLFDTGVRVGELVSLRKDAVDMKHRRATVTGKGRKTRDVFFSPQTAIVLSRYLQRQTAINRRAEWVFIGWRGRPMTVFGVNRMLERRARQAGIESRCNPHLFRHTFATNYLRMGGDPASLQRILGHSDISTTIRIYTHLVSDDLARAHDQFSPMKRVLGR